MSPTKTNLKKYAVAWVALIAIIVAALTTANTQNVKSVKADENYTAGGYSELYTESDVVSKQNGVFYNGSYYDELGGLESLLNGTYEGQDIKEGLRALIGYQSVGNDKGTYVEAFGKTIKGTDECHPVYKGTREGSLAAVWCDSERRKNDAMPEGAFRLFYSNNYGTSLGDYSGAVNREHVWPQSLSGGLFGKSGAGADAHHIRPANQALNGHRSNKKYCRTNQIAVT